MKNTTTTTTTADNKNTKNYLGRIVLLASKTTQNQDHLNVAALSDHEDSESVCLIMDPHLHLNREVANTYATTNNNKNNNITCFQPLSPFD